MTCTEYRDRVEELLDGLLPPEEAGRFEAHARECPECAERSDDAAAFQALLADEGRAAVGDWLAERLVTRATAETEATAGPVADREAPATPVAPGTAAMPAGTTATPATSDRPRAKTGARPTSAVSSRSGGSIAARAHSASEAAVTQEIKPQELLPRTRFVSPRRSRWHALRLSAAAVLVAAVSFFSAGLVGESDVLALTPGVETRVESGTTALASEGRLLSAEDRAVTVTLVEGSDGAEVRVSRGVALFHVAPGRPLAVITSAGVARGSGASFLVDVRGDGAVAIGGVTGRVRFERDGQQTTLRTGERIEIDRHGRSRVVSGSQIDRLEVEKGLWESEFQRIRDRLDVAEQQLIEYGRAVGQDGAATSADDGGLPIDELGRAMRTLLDSKLSYRDPARRKAMGVFLVNADRIQNEYGASDPMRAMTDPRFMAAISESFVRALAPEASESAIAGATADWHAATDTVLVVMESDPMPSELAVARERALARVVRSIERNLGGEAAAEVVRGANHLAEMRPRAETLDERVESRYVSYWQKRFGMDDAQTNELAITVRNYIAETVRAQGVIAATLPPNEIEDALFPRWKRRGWGSGRRHSEPAVDQPEPSASQVVTSKLRQMEARIALAEPRIRFERALWNLLRSDQREKGFGWGARVHSFREAPVE